MKEIKYIIDPSKIEPCDIILTSDKSFTSKGIRVATLGKYSHAAIYVGGTTIEATLQGVFSKSIQRLIFDKENQVAIFRSRRPLLDEEVKKICDYARAQTGTLYALPEAITIRARSILRIPETRKLFCSRLVAKSYEAAGVSLANLRNPAYCTPKQLGLCKAFYRVRDAIRKATEEEIAFENLPDPNIYHQNQTYEWLNKVRSLTLEDESTIEADIQSLNDVNDFLLKFPHYDEIISSFVKSSGYLTFYEYDIRTNPYRYNDESFQIAMRHHPDPVSFIDDLLEIEANLFPKYAQNLEGFIFYAKQQNLEFFRIHIELYTNLIKQVHCRLKAVISFYQTIQDFETVRDLARLNETVFKGITTGEKALIALKQS